MMTLARVTEVGLATVQDAGRSGLAEVGVPVSGAWHQRRYREACRLLGGAEDTLPAIELLAGRLGLHFAQTATVAVVGPAGISLDGQAAPEGVALQAAPGRELVVEHGGPGPVYVTVAGWEPTLVLGSASTDTFSGICAVDLCVGLPLVGHHRPSAARGDFVRRTSDPSGPLRVVVSADPGDDDTWLTGPWHVAATARSGTRLVGASPPELQPVPSTPVLPGTIQATPAGELIILGPDGALTGGYPIVGVVCSADLPRVSEFGLGAEVTLAPIEIAEAVRAFGAGERSSVVVRPDHAVQDGLVHDGLVQDGSIAGG